LEIPSQEKEVDFKISEEIAVSLVSQTPEVADEVSDDNTPRKEEEFNAKLEPLESPKFEESEEVLEQ
jgi:hypothetical protein